MPSEVTEVPDKEEVIAPVVEAVVTETPTTEVVPEITPEPEVDFNDFLKVTDKPLVPDPTPKVEVKKDDKVVPEVKPEVKVEGAKLEAGKTKVVTTRDYSGLPDTMVPLFKTMSNDAFNALKPFYLESVATKAKYDELLAKPAVQANGKPTLPDSYYEHPNAYTLTPEYAEAANNAQESQLVLEHWREQLDNVRAGATTYNGLSRNTQGQIVYTAPIKVDQRSQSHLESMFYNCNNQASQFAQALGAVKQSFITKHTEGLAELSKYEKEMFKVYEDPKHPALPIIADTLSKMHPAFRKNPLAPFCVKAAVTIQALSRALAAKEKPVTVATTERVAAAQAAAGPTASGQVAAEVAKKGDDVTFDDFKVAMGKEL